MGQSAGPRNYTRVYVCPCGCVSVAFSLYTTLQMCLVIYVYVGTGANAHTWMRVHVQGMDRRSRASLPLHPLVPSFSIAPLVSRFLPPLTSFALPPLPSPRASFLSLFLPLSFYDPQSALPPTRLVRTIGVSTLETLHAWHTCKRARKSTQYRYRRADTEKSARKPVTGLAATCRRGRRGRRREEIERKMYPSSVFIDSS